jgi:hypothetical protein
MNDLEPWLWLIPFAGLLLFVLVWRFYRLGREIQAERARESFRLQHERLERIFLETASSSGLPRGLRWLSCVFGAEIEFAREKQTGRVVALVAATIEFEAIEGGDMEGLPAVPLPRQGTAVLRFVRGEWSTSGRLVFNLSPNETAQHFASEYALLRRSV